MARASRALLAGAQNRRKGAFYCVVRVQRPNIHSGCLAFVVSSCVLLGAWGVVLLEHVLFSPKAGNAKRQIHEAHHHHDPLCDSRKALGANQIGRPLAQQPCRVCLCLGAMVAIAVIALKLVAASTRRAPGLEPPVLILRWSARSSGQASENARLVQLASRSRVAWGTFLDPVCMAAPRENRLSGRILRTLTLDVKVKAPFSFEVIDKCFFH